MFFEIQKRFLSSPNPAAAGAAEHRNTLGYAFIMGRNKFPMTPGTFVGGKFCRRLGWQDSEFGNPGNFMVRDAVYLIRIKPGAAASAAVIHVKFPAAICSNGEFLQ